ncbi:hypothetical protein [Curtobacterium sp. MCBA15_012]|uniref:hypothetical protein n=1 Tax=Curtobacterium sp. MCBA15_012 TaxID=1898738 RepID=UPI0011133CD2|nr:hypothetical protein [Curtobacterium sp. MCBA15_012]WIB01596.1 hypothetical protein QOL15_07885 [Curtobacterium sp. MCBA15_012]
MTYSDAPVNLRELLLRIDFVTEGWGGLGLVVTTPRRPHTTRLAQRSLPLFINGDDLKADWPILLANATEYSISHDLLDLDRVIALLEALLEEKILSADKTSTALLLINGWIRALDARSLNLM